MMAGTGSSPDSTPKTPHGHGDGSRSLRVVEWRRRADVLTRPALPCLAPYHTLNLTAGCPNECRYCYAQSYAHHPGWGTVAFFSNMLTRLREELPRLRHKPALVYFSTASEPFLPIPRILADLYEIMFLLLEAGSALLISTKGVIPDDFAVLFARHSDKVQVQVGLTTLEDEVRQVIEPRAASVSERLNNIELLIAHGVKAEARMDPLVPGLTDTEDSLRGLMEGLARCGVKQGAASFLFLRWGINFPNDLSWGDWSARTMRRLYTHKVTDYCGGGKIWLPSTEYRKAKYELIGQIASARDIEVKPCGCKNSDLTHECCHPLPAMAPEADEAQMTLF